MLGVIGSMSLRESFQLRIENILGQPITLHHHPFALLYITHILKRIRLQKDEIGA
jgi:hypothetical protein